MDRDWRWLRNIGKLRITNISYGGLVAIPIFLRLINMSLIRGTSQGETSWTMTCLYFACVFIALAQTLYQIFCPELVKDHESIEDYELKVLSIAKGEGRLPNEFLEIRRRILKKYSEALKGHERVRRLVVVLYFAGIILTIVVIGRNVVEVIGYAWRDLVV